MKTPETLKHEDFIFRVEPPPPRALLTVPMNKSEEIKIDRNITVEEAKDVIRKLVEMARPHLFASKASASPEVMESLLKRGHGLIAAGILSEEGGDPEAGLEWIAAVEKEFPKWGPEANAPVN